MSRAVRIEPRDQTAVVVKQRRNVIGLTDMMQNPSAALPLGPANDQIVQPGMHTRMEEDPRVRHRLPQADRRHCRKGMFLAKRDSKLAARHAMRCEPCALRRRGHQGEIEIAPLKMMKQTLRVGRVNLDFEIAEERQFDRLQQRDPAVSEETRRSDAQFVGPAFMGMAGILRATVKRRNAIIGARDQR